MNQELNKISKDKEAKKSSLNPIIKLMDGNKIIIRAIRDGKNLADLKDIDLVNPI